jgi:hypothetical protein
MISDLVIAFGLGLAGIDPLGALLLLSAIAAGISGFKIKLFTITVFFSTIITGVLLSLVGVGIIDRIKSGVPNETSVVWVFVNITIALVISIWLVRKSQHKPTLETKKQKKTLKGSNTTVFLIALLFGIGAVFDPTFLANISFAAQTSNITSMIAMHTIWIVISQIMFFVLFIAYLLGKQEKLITISKQFLNKHRTSLNTTVFTAGILSVFFLIADSLSYFIFDKYIF